jgi:hypothetical protein
VVETDLAIVSGWKRGQRPYAGRLLLLQNWHLRLPWRSQRFKSLVAKIKKRHYVYYHCSRAKGKCPEPYTREEVLEERSAELLDRLRFDNQVLAWVSQALRVSHDDEKQHHEDVIRRIQVEYDCLQNRIDAMYVDKLDGRINTDFFNRKAAEWRAEQQKCLELIRGHQDANQTDLDEGIRLLELAQKAGS